MLLLLPLESTIQGLLIADTNLSAQLQDTQLQPKAGRGR